MLEMGGLVGALLGAFVLAIASAYRGFTAFNISISGLLTLRVLLFFPLSTAGTLKEQGKLPAFLEWDQKKRR